MLKAKIKQTFLFKKKEGLIFGVLHVQIFIQQNIPALLNLSEIQLKHWRGKS